ncbi:MAG: RpiB/LacA/LacB family sugar-phosphate isomerase [Candidatus Roizmanbacteria bacterium]|nr:RpiB/LacA/LacB family sugar-phosphate isomerase [Candidatus Roizmanbacteria bacterium]
MRIYIAADHRGFSLKNDLVHYLVSKKYDVKDESNKELDIHDDYPDFVFSLSENMTQVTDRGIVICGSGVGVSISANRYSHIRCALGFDVTQIKDARQDEDVNVLAIASDFASFELSKSLVDIFLTTQFKNEGKYIRRLEKLNEHSHDDCAGCSCDH